MRYTEANYSTFSTDAECISERTFPHLQTSCSKLRICSTKLSPYGTLKGSKGHIEMAFMGKGEVSDPP